MTHQSPFGCGLVVTIGQSGLGPHKGFRRDDFTVNIQKANCWIIFYSNREHLSQVIIDVYEPLLTDGEHYLSRG